jgi:hypothetical protein
MLSYEKGGSRMFAATRSFADEAAIGVTIM